MLKVFSRRPSEADATPRPAGTDGVPGHVAIIMDGNGRWAKARGLPRIAGHKRGINSVRKVTREAKALGIRHLTIFAFSTENWLRPKEEVHGLMDLFRLYMRRECRTLAAEGVRVRFIGDPSGMPMDVQGLMDEAQALTAQGDVMTLTVALNYGARAEMVRAAKRIAERVAAGEMTPDEVDDAAFADGLDTAGLPDPDLLIRTSGEQRLSNFLLWQLAYSEFLFVDRHWPDFDEACLRDAVARFADRDRRFGAVR